MTTKCPSCDAEYVFSEGAFGRIVWCRACGVEFGLPTQTAYSMHLWTWVVGAVVVVGMVFLGVAWLQDYLESKRHAPSQTPMSLEIPAIKEASLASGKSAEEAAAELLRKAKEQIAEKKFETAKRYLIALLDNYPDTKAAKEARELLELLI